MIGLSGSLIPARPASQGIRRPTGTRPRLFARVSGSRLHTQPLVGTHLNFRRSATDGREFSATVFSSLSL